MTKDTPKPPDPARNRAARQRAEVGRVTVMLELDQDLLDFLPADPDERDDVVNRMLRRKLGMPSGA